jgi:hypothetical protein
MKANSSSIHRHSLGPCIGNAGWECLIYLGELREHARVPEVLEGVLQSEFDLSVIRSSVGNGGASGHIDTNLRAAAR